MQFLRLLGAGLTYCRWFFFVAYTRLLSNVAVTRVVGTDAMQQLAKRRVWT
jgi:hypothetical protein